MTGMLVLDAAAVDVLIDADLALAAAERTAAAVAAGRTGSGRAEVRADGAWLRVLPGVLPDLDLIGYKAFHGAPGNGVRYLCHLFRLSTGEPLGVVDAARVTALRTAAHASLAVRHAFGDRPIRAGVVGSGHEARQGLRALARSVQVSSAAVFSPRPESRRRYATEMTEELGLPVVAAGSVRECLDGADLGYSATTSRGAIVIGPDDLEGLPMLATIGSTNPHQREVAGAAFGAAAELVLDTRDALTTSGDLIEGAATRSLPADVCLLGEYLSRAPKGGFVIYKSIGGAEQDLILAYEVLMLARSKGVGLVAEAPASIIGGPAEAVQGMGEAAP